MLKISVWHYRYAKVTHYQQHSFEARKVPILIVYVATSLDTTSYTVQVVNYFVLCMSPLRSEKQISKVHRKQILQDVYHSSLLA